jgi:hypothetical protein
MLVKIKNKIYDSNKEPIMLILSEEDKENIKNMESSCKKYCSYPEGMEIFKIQTFMNLNKV